MKTDVNLNSIKQWGCTFD